MTIQTIFSRPNALPYSKLVTASLEGIPNTNIAQRTAVVAPAMAHQCGRTLRPASNPSSTTIGNAATRVESHQWPRGSYTCVQVIIHPPEGAIVRSCPLGIVKWGTRGDFEVLCHWAGQSRRQGRNYLLSR